MEAGYSDIVTLASQCRFRDCTHTKEPGCAVLEALNSGRIGAGHYENFVKLGNESEHHQMSHAQRRKKDRDFGHFKESVKKDLEGH